MVTRLLPVEEWARLADTEVGAIWPRLDPAHTSVLVVEEEGRVVGCWLVLETLHVEGLWIAETHRHTVGVARRLWLTMRQLVRSKGHDRVLTAAVSDEVRSLLAHVDAQQIPADSYVLSVQ